MYVFKHGDHVVPLRADRAGCTLEMKKNIGKVLKIYDTTGRLGDFTVMAGVPGSNRKQWFWHHADLRPATPEEIAAAQKPQPLRRGDLVVSNGDIYVVIETNHADGGYWIHAMTGKGGQDYTKAKDLTRIGSIRKKVKRLKAQMGGEK